MTAVRKSRNFIFFSSIFDQAGYVKKVAMGRLEELLLEPMTVPRQLTFTEEIRRLDHVSTNRFEAPLINCYVHLPRMMQQKNSECK